MTQSSSHNAAMPVLRRFDAAEATSMRAVLGELAEALLNWEFWLGLALYDIRRRYIRTYLGPLWSVINAIFFVAVVGLVYTFLFELPVGDLLPHLAAGYFVWLFISGVLTESGSALHSVGIVLKTSRIRPLQVVLRLVARIGLVFLHNAALLILLAFFVSTDLAALPLMLVGIAALFLLAVPTALLLATLCCRLRFIEQIVGNLILVLFFLTPVLWKPDMLSGTPRTLLELNPLFHVIAVVRDPVLGFVPATHSYLVVAGCIALLWALSIFFYARLRRQITFWV